MVQPGSSPTSFEAAASEMMLKEVGMP